MGKFYSLFRLAIRWKIIFDHKKHPAALKLRGVFSS